MRVRFALRASCLSACMLAVACAPIAWKPTMQGPCTCVPSTSASAVAASSENPSGEDAYEMLVAQVGTPLDETLPVWLFERPEVKRLVQEDVANLEASAVAATEPLRDEARIVAGELEAPLLDELRTLRDEVRLADQESRTEDAIVARASLWRRYDESAKVLRARLTSMAVALLANLNDSAARLARFKRDYAVAELVTASVTFGKKNLARIDDVRREIRYVLVAHLQRRRASWCALAIPTTVDQAANPHLARWQRLATVPRSK